jgi:hypothetical protein
MPIHRLALLLPLVCLSAVPARAEDAGAATPARKDPWRIFELSLGTFITDLSSEIQVGTESARAAIDVEEVLGLPTSTTNLSLEMSVRLDERSRLTMSFFDYSRKAERVLGREIEFNDHVYTVGTDVETTFTLQFYNLVYGYSILQDDRVDVALTLGIHGLRTRLALDDTTHGVNVAESFFLPVPLPGLQATFALTPDLFLKQELSFLWFEIGNYEGLMVNSSTALEYALFEGVALGVAFKLTRFDLEMRDDEFPAVDFMGRISLHYSGVMLYTTLFY